MYQTLDDSFCDREMKERRFNIQEASRNGTGQCWVIAKPSDHLQALNLNHWSLLKVLYSAPEIGSPMSSYANFQFHFFFGTQFFIHATTICCSHCVA